ncbi:MAG: hypothetical protein RIC55_07375 [Pirellulaceae bacterium]
MQSTVKCGFLLSVALGIWALLGSVSRAQQATPSLEKVLDEGVAAYKLLAERQGDTEEFSANMARGYLTTALLKVGRRQNAESLYADDETKRRFLIAAEDSLVEITGVLPKIADGTPPQEELLRRHSWAMAFARRGDFRRVAEQAAEYPEQPGAVSYKIRLYRSIVEQQLERKDVAGARESLDKLAAMIRHVEVDDSQVKADYLLDLARLSCQAGELARAREACRMADEILRPLFRVDQRSPYGIGFSFRELATLQAQSGEPAQARDLLVFFRQRITSLKDEREQAHLLFDLEIATARVAESSGRKKDALTAYDRALKWGIREVELETPNPLTNAIRESEFLNAFFSLADNSHFRTVALGQLKTGDLKAAMETWKQMPLCFNKPSTLLEMAEILHERGDTEEARKLATRCAEMIRPEFTAEDYVLVTSFVANIHRAVGDDAAARDVLEKLTASPRVKESAKAQQMVASEFMNLHLYPQAYALIQSIESPANRALPLAKLAHALLKSTGQ